MQKLHKSDILRSAKPIDGKNPCVYFLISNSEIVYVGFSESVIARIEIHKKDKDFDSACLQKMPSRNIGFTMERYYIDLFKPKYNSNSIFTRKGKKSITHELDRFFCDFDKIVPLVIGRIQTKARHGIFGIELYNNNHYLVLNMEGVFYSAILNYDSVYGFFTDNCEPVFYKPIKSRIKLNFIPPILWELVLQSDNGFVYKRDLE